MPSHLGGPRTDFEDLVKSVRSQLKPVEISIRYETIILRFNREYRYLIYSIAATKLLNNTKAFIFYTRTSTVRVQ